MSKRATNRAFYRWLISWLTVCLMMSFVAGGINCRCPEDEPPGNYKPDGSDEPTPDECFCVKPGSPCEVDGDCRTKLKYCIFLICSNKTCTKPQGTSIPDLPPKESTQEQTEWERPPTCPETCTVNADCDTKLCGPKIFCKEGRCKPDFVAP